MTPPETPSRPLLGFFDPGYLFLLSGLVLLAATVLIPAQQDLADARWRRDAAIAHEQSHHERFNRYQQYLLALDRGERPVIESLSLSQLNVLPDGAEPIGYYPATEIRTASIFHQLEPPPPHLPERQATRSMLATLVSDRDSRLWVFAFAAICVLYSVLPRGHRPV